MPENISYKKPYLTEVIVRVDWLDPIEGIAKSLPKELSRKAKQKFPIVEPRKTVLQEVQLSLAEGFQSKETEATEWNFHSKDRTKTLTIVRDALFIRYTEYESFEVLKEDFVHILSAFFVHYKDAQPNRLGLRYVNNIRLDEAHPRDWQEYIHERLLCSSTFYPQPELLARNFSSLELNFGDFNLRFQFGMYNPDFPAVIKRKAFILDFDAYYQGVQEKEEVFANLDKYHEKIQELFEMSIMDSFRRKLNERA